MQKLLKDLTLVTDIDINKKYVSFFNVKEHDVKMA